MCVQIWKRWGVKHPCWGIEGLMNLTSFPVALGRAWHAAGKHAREASNLQQADSASSTSPTLLDQNVVLDSICNLIDLAATVTPRREFTNESQGSYLLWCRLTWQLRLSWSTALAISRQAYDQAIPVICTEIRLREENVQATEEEEAYSMQTLKTIKGLSCLPECVQPLVQSPWLPDGAADWTRSHAFACNFVHRILRRSADTSAFLSMPSCVCLCLLLYWNLNWLWLQLQASSSAMYSKKGAWMDILQ